MLKRLGIVVVMVAVLFGGGLFLGFIVPHLRQQPAPVQIQNTATLLKQVQTISELSTVKYIFEKLVVLDDVKWYGDNRVTLVAHGVVKAGIDFKKLGTNDMVVSEKKISLKLPSPFITDAYLDDKRTRVLERNTGLMRNFDRDLEQNARRQAVNELKGAALENGIIKDADERARALLENLFHQLGFTEVEFRGR
ncbi:MAG: DUF4230 domain-containing protein [Verrucomicrobiota bacterium]